jgi:glycosyltransferase involved in cell wall biosynthesis
MRVVLATTQVPFVRGGAELHAENLRAALVEAEHEAEIVAIPFKWYPPERILDHMLACRLMDLESSTGQAIDCMIGLKFPAYLMPHPNKVMWLMHQHRGAYDSWDSSLADLMTFPEGKRVRQAIQTADDTIIPEFKRIFTISRNVSERLLRFNGIASTPLHHPPPGTEALHPGAYEDYLLVPGRIDPSKRQDLVIEALALTRQPVKAIFFGGANAPSYEAALRQRMEQADLRHRIQWLGAVPHERRAALYADCLGVVFPPIDEDYGYVTLEAMLCAKPVITCADSGTPLEFVAHEESGLITEPEPAALAAAFDRLWSERQLARRMGEAGLARYRALNLNWPSVIARLLA